MHEIGRGAGADVLGHPHHALAWLANHLAAGGLAVAATHADLGMAAARALELDLMK